jgi:aspartate aminotransferase-like enzyme
MDDITFKRADAPDEYEQIHRLNYRTFVEEIPQHAPDPSGRLVDRFHDENVYVIALHAGALVGMVALRPKRPFSLDAKLPELDSYLPHGRALVEVRLLSIEPAWRGTALCAELLAHTMHIGMAMGFDTAVISGTTRQLRLYERLGFVPFGPLVGSGDALYQPMFLTLEAVGQAIEQKSVLRQALLARGGVVPRPVNLLPGPVRTTAEVDAAFRAPPISHRSPEFLTQLARVRSRLCALTGAADVQVIPGSGSVATSIIAAQLAVLDSPGLVISNGEFGERLAAEAQRAGLRFDWMQLPWGSSYDVHQVRSLAERLPRGAWVWAVHHETSTGALNPVDELAQLCDVLGLRCCVDCVSSLGAVPVDLRRVHLASASSGKGLGAYPGLALVFHSQPAVPQPERLPSYLDLGHWASHGSVPHTVSSNLVAALDEALAQATPARMARLQANSAWLFGELGQRGFSPVVPMARACPAGVTMVFDDGTHAASIGEHLERRGFLTSFRSRHLLSRNWLQVSLLGDPPREELEWLVEAMGVRQEAMAVV